LATTSRDKAKEVLTTKRTESPDGRDSNLDDELDAIVRSVSNGKVTTLKKL
jgi:hypothetical protein